MVPFVPSLFVHVASVKEFQLKLLEAKGRLILRVKLLEINVLI